MSQDSSQHTCLNCGALVTTKYCGECGQEAKPPVLSVRQLLSSTVENYLSLDSKLVRSLRPLFFHPGKLSQEYVRGRREHYVSPIRLYLVATLIFFLVAAFVVERSDTSFLRISNTSTQEQQQAALADSLDAVTATRDSLEAPVASGDSLETASVTEASPESLGTPAPGLETSEVSESAPDSASADSTVGDPDAYRKTKRSFAEKLFQTDPRIVSAEFVRQLPRVLFVLVPVFALLLKLIYIRRKRFYVEHLVFALHTHALVFMIATPATILRIEFVGAAVAILSVLYLYVSMKRFYEQGWFKTLLKSVMLLFAYFLALAPAMVIALGLTVMFALD